MLKNILGFVAGLVVAWVVFSVLQAFNVVILPKPEGFDPNSQSYWKEFVSQMPAYGFFMLGLSHMIATFVGGIVLGRIAHDKSLVFPVGMGILLMLLWTANIVVIPHPLWFVVLIYLVYVPSAVFGFQTGSALRGSPDGSS